MGEEHLTPEDWSGLVVEEVEEEEKQKDIQDTQDDNVSQYIAV